MAQQLRRTDALAGCVELARAQARRQLHHRRCSTVEQLKDNLAASSWSLSDAEIAALDQASAVPPVYPYNMHYEYMADRNPIAPLQAPLPGGA